MTVYTRLHHNPDLLRVVEDFERTPRFMAPPGPGVDILYILSCGRRSHTTVFPTSFDRYLGSSLVDWKF